MEIKEKEQLIPSKDGEMVSNILNDRSSQARAVGRNVVYTIIATLWALTYSRGELHEHDLAKWALILALVYVFLDMLHYVVITAVYKYILVYYFMPIDGGFVYKKGKDASYCTYIWMNVGFIWLIIMSLILLTSSILLIMYAWDLTQETKTTIECCIKNI